MIDRGAGYLKKCCAANGRGCAAKRNELEENGMAIEVAKVELKTVKDASGIEELHQGRAVHGRPGGRGHRQDRRQWRRQRLHPHPGRSGVPRAAQASSAPQREPRSHKIPMVWSGGCDGVITPHATVFARNDKTGPASKARLVIGTAHERRTAARGHRPSGDGREGRRGREGGDDGRRHFRSGGRALRPDQDAAADHRIGARRRKPRPARGLRGA